MRNLEGCIGTWGEATNPHLTSQGISFMQMNFWGSETTWLLCQQEMVDQNLRPDVILIQDSPFSICVGKNIFRGYRAIRPVSHGPCHVVILIQDCVHFLSAWPFGQRVVGIELLGCDGPIMGLSAYIRQTIGEGLEDLARVIRWVKGQSPCVLVGLDGNGGVLQPQPQTR